MNQNGQDRESEDKLISELLRDLHTLDRVMPDKTGPSAESWALVIRERWRITAWIRKWEVVLFCVIALMMISGVYLFALTIPVFYAWMQGIGFAAAITVAVTIKISQKRRMEG